MFCDKPGGGGGGGTSLQETNSGDLPLDGVAFHDWSDYNGAAFSTDLLQWGRKFSGFGVSRDENGTILG